MPVKAVAITELQPANDRREGRMDLDNLNAKLGGSPVKQLMEEGMLEAGKKPVESTDL